MAWDGDGFLKPNGPADWYSQPSEVFSAQCPFSPAAANEDAIAAERFPDAPWRDGRLGRFEAAYVGYAAEPGFRANGSSGGMTSWVAAELLRSGRVDARRARRASGSGFARRLLRIPRVAHARRARTPAPSHAIIRSSCREVLARNPGRRPGATPIVGVPCFIKAIHLLRADRPGRCGERVTHTLGLFCGHMKSAAMVESFAWQLGKEAAAGEGARLPHQGPNPPGKLVSSTPRPQGRKRRRAGLVAPCRWRLGRGILPEPGVQLVRRRGCGNRGHCVRRRLGRALFSRRPRH